MKVILVDDDRVFLLLHKMVINFSGLATEVIEFTQSEDCLQYFEKQDIINTSEQYLLFVDVHMPRLDGITLLGELDKLPIKHLLKAIVVSSSVNMADKENALSYPFVLSYIEKPLEKHHILDTVMPKLASHSSK